MVSHMYKNPVTSFASFTKHLNTGSVQVQTKNPVTGKTQSYDGTHVVCALPLGKLSPLPALFHVAQRIWSFVYRCDAKATSDIHTRPSGSTNSSAGKTRDGSAQQDSTIVRPGMVAST